MIIKKYQLSWIDLICFNATDDVITVRSRDLKKAWRTARLVRDGNSVQANFKDTDVVISLRSRDLEKLKKRFTSFSTRAIITKIGQYDHEENQLT